MNKFKFIAEEILDHEIQYEVCVKKNKDNPRCPRCKTELELNYAFCWQCPYCLEKLYECQDCHAIHGAVKIIDISGLKLCDKCLQEYFSRLNEERANAT